MERIPYPSYPLVQTTHYPASLDPPHLLSIRVPQQLHLFHYLLFLKIPDAYDLFPAIYVRTPNYGMCIRPWGDVNHDLRVCFSESSDETRAEEIVHASRTTPFVAVVEVEAFALEDEGTYAILGGRCRS